MWTSYSQDKSSELQWEQACTCGPLTTHSVQSAETHIPVWRASHEEKNSVNQWMDRGSLKGKKYYARSLRKWRQGNGNIVLNVVPFWRALKSMTFSCLLLLTSPWRTVASEGPFVLSWCHFLWLRIISCKWFRTSEQWGTVFKELELILDPPSECLLFHSSHSSHICSI